MNTSADTLLQTFPADADAERVAARDRFRLLGLPTPKQEAWKFTNLRPLEQFIAAAGKPANDAAPDIPAPLIDDSRRILIIDGRVDGDISVADPAGLSIEQGSHLMPEMGGKRAVRDLAIAMSEDGLRITVAADATVGQALELVFVGTGHRAGGHHFTLELSLAANADLTVVERHCGTQAYAATIASAIRLGDGARLRHVKVQDESQEAFHLADSAVEIGRDGTYERFILSVGARLARDEVHTSLNGQGSSVRLLGAYAGRGQQHLDHTTHIDHAVPNTTSHEVYKGVLDDRSRGVFQGGIKVMKDAQKTAGHQLNKALLLSPRAEIDSKPALEIYADDVVCSHGATAGEIDEDALFYLRARGIDAVTAKNLMVQAFLDEIFDGIADETLRDRLKDRVHAALQPGDNQDA
ncbi:MAG: Fe-S cluster assembly protein SufD [Minwuia sp.]|nr:Fe-S cluster assembly protein SufD [Minwuia sp.]